MGSRVGGARALRLAWGEPPPEDPLTETVPHPTVPGRSIGWALAVCALSLGLTAFLVRGWTPTEAALVVPKDTTVVVLGSSIALADVDADLLGQELSQPVLQLGARASQPAHWLAVLKHQVPEEVPLEHVVVVTPFESLLRERLRADVDVERLLALLSRPDPGVWSAAVGTQGHVRFWARQRAALRRSARSALGSWLPGLLGWSDQLRAIRESDDAFPRALDARPRWVTDPAMPRPGSANLRVEQREPEAVDVEQWRITPLLVEEARRRGATIWFVAPPIRPSERTAPCARNGRFTTIVNALGALGAAVIDASDLPVAEHDFRTRYHLESGGMEALTVALARGMTGEALPGRACGTTRLPGGTLHPR